MTQYILSLRVLVKDSTQLLKLVQEKFPESKIDCDSAALHNILAASLNIKDIISLEDFEDEVEFQSDVI